MKIIFCLVIFQATIINFIGAITIENGSNDSSLSTLIFERGANTVDKHAQPVSPHSYNINSMPIHDESLVGKMCDCKCKCCLQLTYSCEHYCVCVEDKTPSHQTCLGDLKFNPDIENCDLPGNFICMPRPTTPPAFQCETEEEYYEYPGNCSLYVQCANFIPYVHFCPANLHFCQSCVPPRCEYQSIANCTAEDGSKRNIIRKSRSIVMEKAVLVDGKSNNNGSIFKCPNKYGFYPVPANPRSFYKCLNGVPTAELKCPLGLVYNPARSSCSKM